MNNIQTRKSTRRYVPGENRKYYNCQKYSNRTFLTLKRTRKLQTNEKNEKEDEINTAKIYTLIEDGTKEK